MLPGAIEHELDREVAPLQVARAEARDREHAVERAVGIAAQRVRVTAAQCEQAETAVANGRAERIQLPPGEPVGRDVVEHDGIDVRVARGVARERGGRGNRRPHAAGGQDRRDPRVGRHGRHDCSGRRADAHARGEDVVLRPLVAGELHAHAEGVPADARSGVGERERIVALVQPDGLDRGLAPIASDRQRRRTDPRRAYGQEQRDRVPLVHGGRRVEPDERRVGQVAALRAGPRRS